MEWKNSTAFYAVIVEGGVVIEEFPRHSNPCSALADVKRRTGLTFIRNERGVSCWPHKALTYFDRRGKDRGKNYPIWSESERTAK